MQTGFIQVNSNWYYISDQPSDGYTFTDSSSGLQINNNGINVASGSYSITNAKLVSVSSLSSAFPWTLPVTANGKVPAYSKQSPARIFDTSSNVELAVVPIWDPARGWDYQEGIKSIDYRLSSDPASYTNSLYSQDISPDMWNNDHKGNIWQDTSSVGYLPYTDISIFPTVEGRISHWGEMADWSDVILYKWIQANIPPDQWDTISEQGTDPSITGTPYSNVINAAGWIKEYDFHDDIFVELLDQYQCPISGEVDIYLNGKYDKSMNVSEVVINYDGVLSAKAKIELPPNQAATAIYSISSNGIIAPEHTGLDSTITYTTSISFDNKPYIIINLNGNNVQTYNQLINLLNNSIGKYGEISITATGELQISSNIKTQSSSVKIYEQGTNIIPLFGSLTTNLPTYSAPISEKYTTTITINNVAFDISIDSTSVQIVQDVLDIINNNIGAYAVASIVNGNIVIVNQTVNSFNPTVDVLVNLTDLNNLFVKLAPIGIDVTHYSSTMKQYIKNTSKYNTTQFGHLNAYIHIRQLVHQPTPTEILSKQYYINYPYTITQQYDTLSESFIPMYNFWIKDQPELINIARNIRYNPAPYMFFQNYIPSTQPNTSGNYTQVIIKGVGNYVTEDDKYILQFVKDYTLRDNYLDAIDPNTALKSTYTEWKLIRPDQENNIARELWNRLTESAAGYKIDAVNFNIIASPNVKIPSLNRILYDKQYNSHTQYGFKDGQIMVNGPLALDILNTVLTDPLINFSPIDIDQFITTNSFDTPENIVISMNAIYTTFSARVVNMIFFKIVNQCFIDNTTLNDMFKTSMLSLNVANDVHQGVIL